MGELSTFPKQVQLNLLDSEAVVSGEALDLFQGHRVHLATRRRRPSPQTDREQATGSY